MRANVLTAAAILLLLVATASTSRGDQASEARQHYQSATAHFAVGEFDKAAAEYQAAYMLKQDPALLFNAAQSYRLANQPDKAIILYKNYLQLYPNEPNAEDVRTQIEKLKETIASRDRTRVAPPPSAPEPKPQPAVVAPAPAPPPTPTLAAGPASPAKHETPAYKKWWVWTIVGVVVAGGAVTAAVLLTRPQASWSNAPDVGPGSSNALVRW